jgi:hypothetical protein
MIEPWPKARLQIAFFGALGPAQQIAQMAQGPKMQPLFKICIDSGGYYRFIGWRKSAAS